MSRPYAQASVIELEELVSLHWGATRKLKQLEKELSVHRTTRKAKELLSRVQERIAELKSPSPSTAIDQTPTLNELDAGTHDAIPRAADRATQHQVAVPHSTHGSNEGPSDSYFAPKEEPPLQMELGFGLHKTDSQPAGSSAPDNMGAQDEAPLIDPWHVKRPEQKLITAPGQSHQPKKRGRKPVDPTTQLRIDESDDIRQNFIKALELSIDETKKDGAGQAIALENGARIAFALDRSIYRFRFNDPVLLREHSPVQVVTASRKVMATVLSVADGHVDIAIEDDLGDGIEFAQILTDDSYLLVRLKERLEDTSKEGSTFQLDLALQAVGKASTVTNVVNLNEIYVRQGTKGKPGPNPEQNLAVQTAVGSQTTYVWGPPGTGKTEVLARIAYEFLRKQKRVLLVSNTNLAVDTLLLRLCKDLKELDDRSVVEGRIVRFGTAQHDELRASFAQQVELHAITERRSSQLVKEKAGIVLRLDLIGPDLLRMQEKIRAFELLDTISAERADLLTKIEDAKRRWIDARMQKETLRGELDRLAVELEQAQHVGPIKSFLGIGTPEKVERRIQETTVAYESSRNLDEAIEQESHHLAGLLPELNRKEDAARTLTAEVDRKGLTENAARLNKEQEQLSARLREIDADIDAIEASIIRDCKVLAATATQSFVRSSEFSAFDAVIVDEASMLVLPVAFYVAGLATSHAVIAGDFRQLPPIVKTKHEVVQRWLGTDIFKEAGITREVELKRHPPQLVSLLTQYRMDPRICDLINSDFYGGRLESGRDEGVCPGEPVPPEPFSAALTLIDTSSLWPFVSTKPGTTSRYNTLHAIAIRNLCHYLLESGYIVDKESIGVITPYAAQSELIEAIVKGSDGLASVDIGTVHRYQGNQKRLIVVDVADSIGLPSISQFASATSVDEAGAKLWNVAFSRSKYHVIVVANLTYLEDKLPSTSLLRGILYRIQTAGKVVDVRDVITLGPNPYPVVSGIQQHQQFNFDTATTNLFDEESFDGAFIADLASAKKSIVIFSGFATESRVAKWADVFRAKIANDNIAIRCVTRPPKHQGSIPEQSVVRALEALTQIGVVVDLRTQVHEKVAIIDGHILWYGSLNPLSHTGHTDETMMRLESDQACESLAVMLSARRSTAQKKAAIHSLTKKENPVCGDCGSPSVLCRSKFGPFFGCLTDCGWKESLDKPKRMPSTLDLTGFDVDPKKKCPECGHPMKPRAGKFGPFYGCTGYPNCKRVEDIKRARTESKPKKRPAK